MCGIAGIFGCDDQKTVNIMLDALAHRGPDDAFLISGADFTLGARRLSIIDITNGRQPVSNETKTIWAAQNGELYNFPTLREKLLERGHQLHTHCDTEILPHLYEDYGTHLVEQIDGMFAFAVWDDAKKVGILGRDRMGKKPLYYYSSGNSLYFASEIKALLRIPGFKRQLNLEALHHYLSYQHVPHPLSIFQKIAILPPAHQLIFRKGEKPEICRYWDVNFSGTNEMANLPEEELVDRILVLLQEGVKRRLMSDVPMGFFLSGGVDSSLSTALAAELSPSIIKTFTLTYSEESTTEGKEQDRKWAKWVAKEYGTEHYEETINFASFPENLRRIITCFDEPFSGVISTFFLAGLISKHVKVALSGDGADELFGSYLPHRLALPLANYTEYQRIGDANLIHPFQNQRELLDQLVESEDWAWRYKLLVFSDEEKADLYSPDLAAAMSIFSTREHFRHYFADLTAQEPLNRMLEAEFRNIFPDQLLTFVDRLSMAHSLEVRSAYLDTDLVTFVANLPGHLKIKNGETKYLLKKAALKYFPEEMVFRPKEGFHMPVAEWILYNLQDYVRQILSPEQLKQHGFFNIAYVQKLINELYQSGTGYANFSKIVSLIVFQEWYGLYMV